jgi:hypothetical protein
MRHNEDAGIGLDRLMAHEFFGCHHRFSEKRGRSFLQTAALKKATGGVTPVASLYQNSFGTFYL